MRTVVPVFLLLSVFVLVTGPAYAYIYFVEADEFDLDRSELNVGGVKEDGDNLLRVSEREGANLM